MKKLNSAVITTLGIILSALIALCFQSCGNAEAYPNNTIPSVVTIDHASVAEDTPQVTETQCTAKTKAGAQCSRNATEGSYCWQHGGKTKTESAGTAVQTTGTCGATTKAGTACKNRVKGGGRCHLHRG